MGTQFPKEFPNQAIQALLRPVFQGSPIDGQVALAAYELLGFGLYQAFGDVQQLSSAESPGHVANMLAQAPPEMQQFMDFTNNQGNQILKGDSLPPWLTPFLQQFAQYAIAKLLERLGNQQAPSLFGIQLKKENRDLPPQTGGAFPERVLGQPTGTGLFTQSTPQPSPAQSGGPQAAPSPNTQQPTGTVPEKHPSTPISSASPQFQGNTADPRIQHEARPTTTDQADKGPGITNSPGVQGNPVVPRESSGSSGKPAQGAPNLLPPANSK